MLTAPHADLRQIAEPRLFIEMQCALSSAEMFRKKADKWDEEHGLGYRLETAALVIGLLPFFWPLSLYFALMRKNPYRDVATCHYFAYERTHDEIAKKHGFPTMKEISRYGLGGPVPKAWRTSERPTQTQRRKPAPRATLAA
jgi:hypothetical protein